MSCGAGFRITIKGRWSSTKNNWIQLECLQCGNVFDEHQEARYIKCTGFNNSWWYKNRSYGSGLKPKPDCLNVANMNEVIETVDENRVDLKRRPTNSVADWVYIGSFRTVDAAETFKAQMIENNPGLDKKQDFWKQVGGGQDEPIWFDKEAPEPRVKTATKSGGKKSKDEDE